MEKTDGKRTAIGSFGWVLYAYWLPVFLWMGIIFLLSSRQSVSVSAEYLLNFLFFKTLHLIEYAVLFTLFTRAIHQSLSSKKVVNPYAAAFVLTVLYAATDEFHQQFVPSRQGSPRDVIIDGIGAGIVWFYLSTQLQKAPQKLKFWVKKLEIPS